MHSFSKDNFLVNQAILSPLLVRPNRPYPLLSSCFQRLPHSRFGGQSGIFYNEMMLY